uniref:Uncharacterized protein n=1 Tax=Arundo donax TaxID=35708 RepID=A0A0A8YCQ9_ARUDO
MTCVGQRLENFGTPKLWQRNKHLHRKSSKLWQSLAANQTYPKLQPGLKRFNNLM